ncbi:MAG TPA: hypothetical protein GX392_01000 [Clostridiales bacterium]|nr:hypothetical protein [Clostridiales bacterium]
MYINIAGKNFEWNEKDINSLLNFIEDKLSESHLYFSHMIIDGEPIYENFDMYIQDNIDNIDNINIIARTLKEFAEDILYSTYEYIQEAIPQLESLCNKLYIGVDEYTLLDLNDFLEALEWIFDSTATIDSLNATHNATENFEEWNEYVKAVLTLKKFLPQLLEAMENEDSILLSDLILYEVIETLNNMSNAIVSMIGVAPDEVH